MLNLGIESESDMEFAIYHVIDAAKSNTMANKHVTIHFNNDTMMDIFMNNLFIQFEKDKVPKDSGLHLSIVIAEEHDE
tara:strand:- start:321 stop:554 length:234 start_codon:yes stop_codon:yes gene_type:complete